MTQQPLHLQGHGLFSAHPTETWDWLWAARLLSMTSTAFTNVQGHGEAMQVSLWVQCAYNTTWGRSDPQCSPSAAQECCTAV